MVAENQIDLTSLQYLKCVDLHAHHGKQAELNLVGVMSLVVDSNVYIIIIRASVDRDGKGEISRDPGTKRLKLIRTFSRPRENLLIRDFTIFVSS